jgi:hypothetical protein
MDYLKEKGFKKDFARFITGPFIWLPLPFFILLDMVISLYQFICFPVYGIEKVKRSAYILILDRNKLQYLNNFQKISCMYCGYGNGLLLYIKEIAGLTEKYWCGIMHEEVTGFIPQHSQKALAFAKFDDVKDFIKKYVNDKYK